MKSKPDDLHLIASPKAKLAMPFFCLGALLTPFVGGRIGWNQGITAAAKASDLTALNGLNGIMPDVVSGFGIATGGVLVIIFLRDLFWPRKILQGLFVCQHSERDFRVRFREVVTSTMGGYFLMRNSIDPKSMFACPNIKAHLPGRKFCEVPHGYLWADLTYRLHVRQKIAAGLADIETGRIHSHESIRREFGLDV